jgi:Amidohydrolase family
VDSILFNGRVTTLDPAKPSASAVAIDSGVFVAVGSYREIMALRGAKTKVLDLRGRPVIPGLNDSHTHLIRGGLNYNMELRWGGVPSLTEAMASAWDSDPPLAAASAFAQKLQHPAAISFLLPRSQKQPGSPTWWPMGWCARARAAGGDSGIARFDAHPQATRARDLPAQPAHPEGARRRQSEIRQRSVLPEEVEERHQDAEA